MSDVRARLEDLFIQATTERSHHYTAGVILETLEALAAKDAEIANIKQESAKLASEFRGKIQEKAEENNKLKREIERLKNALKQMQSGYRSDVGALITDLDLQGVRERELLEEAFDAGYDHARYMGGLGAKLSPSFEKWFATRQEGGKG